MSVAALRQSPVEPGRRLAVQTTTWSSEKSKHVIVAVTGEVDACNAKEFAVAMSQAVAGAKRVTLDLSEMEFVAFDGVAALHAVNAHLTRAGVPWCVLPGPAVTRVLDLCDPERLIPLAQPDATIVRRGAALRLVKPA